MIFVPNLREKASLL